MDSDIEILWLCYLFLKIREDENTLRWVLNVRTLTSGTGELEAAENFGPGPELISSDTDTDWQRLGEEKNWKMGSRGPVTSNYFQI